MFANEVSEVALLRRAREILKSGGWIKGELSDGKGRHCALGAIEAASSEFSDKGKYVDYGTRSEALRALARTISSSADGVYYNGEYQRVIWQYNDYEATEVDDVLRKFNTAIRNLKESAV